MVVVVLNVTVSMGKRYSNDSGWLFMGMIMIEGRTYGWRSGSLALTGHDGTGGE